MEHERENETAEWEFWICSVVWHSLPLYAYTRLLFCSIFSFTDGQSRLILYAMVLGNYLCNAVYAERNRDRREVVFLTALLPYVLYAFFAYSGYFRVLSAVLAGLTGAVLCVYLFWTWARPYPRNRRRGDVIRSRLRLSALYLRSIPTLLLFPLLAVVSVIAVGDGTLAPTVTGRPSQVETAPEREVTEWIGLFREDSWAELSREERVEALRYAADHERRRMGIYHPVWVRSGETDRDSTLGNYSRMLGCITINAAYLESCGPMEAVRTLAHECRHAYQHCLVVLLEHTDEPYRGLYLFAGVERYAEEFANYCDGGSDLEEFDTYYAQAIERDAREYAANAVDRYTAMIGLLPGAYVPRPANYDAGPRETYDPGPGYD